LEIAAFELWGVARAAELTPVVAMFVSLADGAAVDIEVTVE